MLIPREVIERDYGCGDPSRWLREGETVLDLGSGTGKICFIAAQVVGPKGRVIGVDMTDDMLEVARRNAPIVADRVGYANVEFRKGRIQDLALTGHRLRRGVRHGVCDKTFQLYRKAPYRDHFEFVEPLTPVPLEKAEPFDCPAGCATSSARDEGTGVSRDHGGIVVLRRRQWSVRLGFRSAKI